MSSDAEEEGLDLFQEPTDFYEPEKQATFASHQLLSGKELTVRLVGHNPLWVRVLATTVLPKQSTGLPIIIDIGSKLLKVFQRASRSHQAALHYV
jgi:hypothetical protein